ncbi:alpha/beta hydrolase family protein [Sphingomonas nostoxanthinifaciens]|uniref:alpha/beta hydrolase family protein n=1 Tax=Sphingomonas nostoxanthinifaciens TaxID=2872652 RepID=UPI001CC1C602|nr:S9 family peptidase [Sphingomonas nostoxanthinifaciens]
MKTPLRTAFAALLLAAAPAAIAAAPIAPARTFGPLDLFGLEAASDPQISPDGTKIVYVRKSNDIMTDRARSTLWLVDVKSGAQTPLVASAGAHLNPRWSPDGTRLAYISTADGGGAQLYVRWMTPGGGTARVTSLPSTPGAVAWSPDGTRLAYLLTVPGTAATLGTPLAKPEGAQWAPSLQVITKLVYRQDEGGYGAPGFDHLFVIAADGGSPRQLTFGSQDEEGPLSWTKDDRTILVASNRTDDAERNPNRTDIFAVDVASGATSQLTHRAGPNGNAVVSPDGAHIAYLGFEDRLLGSQTVLLSVMDRDGNHDRVLTAKLDRSVGSPVWAADGKAIYVKYDDHGVTRVARVGLDGAIRTEVEGLVQSVFDRPYTGGAFSVAKDGTVAFTGGTALRPADVMIAHGGAARRLTQLNEEALSAKALGQVRHLSVTSAFDRAPIDAWMVTPPDFDPSRKYPMILEIHGGPFAAYGPSFSSDDQLYAAAGYVVLYANPRGSTSYGEAFANQIHHSYPAHDYDDLMSAVDAAIADGHVDADRLYVTGGSGGGLLTSWIVGKTDRFKAAAAQKPVIDWASFVLTADQTNYFAKYWFGKFPWEDPQGYWARSPLSLAGNVKTPTLVVVGSADYRTPVSEAEQFYTALKLRGVPTELVKVPGANHEGLAEKPSQSAAKAEAILAWFGRYGGEPARP